MQRKGVQAPPAKIIFQEGQTGDVGTPGAFIARSGLRDGGNVSHSGVGTPRLDCLQKVSVPFNGGLTMAPKTNSGDKRCLRRSWAMTQNPFLAGDTRYPRPLLTWRSRWGPLPISPNPVSSSLWRPLRSSTFRNLLTANVVSDVGTFMQSVGAAWLMVSLNGGPMYVALADSFRPAVLRPRPTGRSHWRHRRSPQNHPVHGNMDGSRSTCDCCNHHRGHDVPRAAPHSIFALSAGDAFESPTWRAVLPELVEKEDLPAASALNGIEFNFARAVGPALAGAVVAFAGVGAAFLINTVSFLGVIIVVARWRRPVINQQLRLRP